MKIIKDELQYKIKGECSKYIEDANNFLESHFLRGLSPLSLRSYGYDLIIINRWLLGINKELKKLMK